MVAMRQSHGNDSANGETSNRLVTHENIESHSNGKGSGRAAQVVGEPPSTFQSSDAIENDVDGSGTGRTVRAPHEIWEPPSTLQLPDSLENHVDGSGTGRGPQEVGGPSSRLAMKWLDLSRSIIEEKNTKMLARALENNELTNLKGLFLHENAGDLGMRAMLNALSAGHLKGLEQFIMWEVSSYDQITTAEEGTDTIAAAIENNLMPNLRTLDLTGSLMKLVPARRFDKAFWDLMTCKCGDGRLLESSLICLRCLVCSTTEKGKSQTLKCLKCQFFSLHIYNGDSGVKKIVRALSEHPGDNPLRVLNLQANYIGDIGATVLATSLKQGKLPHLEELDLHDNPVGPNGASEIVLALLQNPLLTVRVKLDWPNLVLKERAIAFRESNIRLEHRLEVLKIPLEKISINNYRYPKHDIKRRTGRCLRENHRLHLECQAHYDDYPGDLVDHEVMHPKKPEGIEIRTRRWLCDSPKESVDREVETSESERDTRSQIATEEPKFAKAIHRIYIQSGPVGFITTAKALGKQPHEMSRLQAWHSRIRKFCQDKGQTEQRMKNVKEELLVLAERKADEFFHMFGLRQVLLTKGNNEMYSRIWICQSCFKKYRDRGDDSVQAVTTDEETLKLRSFTQKRRKQTRGSNSCSRTFG